MSAHWSDESEERERSPHNPWEEPERDPPRWMIVVIGIGMLYVVVQVIRSWL